MPEPRELNIKEASNLIRSGELSAMDLLSSCLERIQEREEIRLPPSSQKEEGR